MITKRIIPCLNVRNGRMVKGGTFLGLYEELSPVELSKFYFDCGADELVFFDMAEPFEDRSLYANALKEVASNLFIPLNVGGNVCQMSDFELALSCGADKVSVNLGMIKDPALIGQAAKRYGNQSVVLYVDVKRVNGEFYICSNLGKDVTELKAIEWIKRCVDDGAGEVVVNSMDTVATRKGFDLPLLKKVCESVNVPVVASGGAGCKEDFLKLFEEIPTIDAGLAATAFHFGEISIPELKKELAEKGIFVRR